MKAVAGAMLLALMAAVLTVVPSAAAATRECNGLQICVPIAGPWVVVPTGGATRTTVQFQLDCPRGYVVGGLDAELTSRSIDISFAATLGSPVNPGISTSRTVVFSATYVGSDARALASMRPHIGCIPLTGGGGRVPTAASAIFRPGQPTTRRTRTVQIRVGSTRVVQACASGERLISASHAVGFYSQRPPSAALTAAVRTRQTVGNGRIVVVAQSAPVISSAPAVVQVGAVCAGGK